MKQKKTKKRKKREIGSLKTICRWLAEIQSIGWSARVQRNGFIRLAAPGEKTYCFCPFTALALARFGVRIEDQDFQAALILMPVSDSVRKVVVDAADSGFTEIARGRLVLPEQKKIVETARRAMLRALGR